MGVELHGPVWAWMLIGVYLIVVRPFVENFARAAIEDWRHWHE